MNPPPCVLNGLDGASTTTIPPDAENLIVTGAAGSCIYLAACVGPAGEAER